MGTPSDHKIPANADFRQWSLAEDAPLWTPVTGSDAASALERVQAVSAQRPEMIAVEAGPDSLSYELLRRQAAGVTQWLRDHGVGPGSRVGILADKVCGVYPAMLGILGAGAAFVPLDPDAPLERNRLLIDQAGMNALVTHAQTAAEIGQIVPRVLLVDEPLPFQRAKLSAIIDLPLDHSTLAGTPEATAYVIFTSGSSGQPKGVEVDQRSLDNFAAAISDLAACSPGSRVTQGAKLCFDASLQQIFTAFLTGATLVPVPDDVRAEGTLMLDWLETKEITHWDSVPTLWAPVVDALRRRSAREHLPALKTLLLAGEAPRPRDINDWLNAVPLTRLFNMYGPTEATVDATGYLLTEPVGNGPVPIGTPLSGVGAYVVDASGHVCEPHMEGEIVLEGVCLARGYLNDPEATAAAFEVLVNPDGTHRRRYRTGDLGYRLPDGNLVCTGRRDGQIKINGVRIEPREVEIALLRVPGIREAAVTATGFPQDGTSQLVAVAVTDDQLDPSDVRAQLSTKLPRAMVPARVVRVRAIPRTASGKVDPHGIGQLIAHTPDDHPSSAVSARELTVLAACRQILGDAIGVDDDLFHAGLDSVSSLRLRAALTSQGFAVRTQDLFRHTTVRTLCAAIDVAESHSTVTATDQGARAEVPLMPSQRALLAAAVADGTGQTGLVQEVHYFDRQLSPDLVRQALEHIVSRYDAFRAAIDFNEGGEHRLRVSSRTEVVLEPEIRRVEPESLTESVNDIAAAELATGFDLTSAPLLRLAMVSTPDACAVVWTMHHLVTDGWSWELVTREFAEVYLALDEGIDAPVYEPGPSLAKLAGTPLDTLDDDHLDPLLSDLVDVEGVDLGMPTVSPNPVAAKRSTAITVPGDQAAKLHKRAHHHSATPSAMFLHITALALARLTGQTDISVGLVTSGRDRDIVGIENAIAPLARIIPVGWQRDKSNVKDMHRQIRRAVSLDGFDVDSCLARARVPIGIRAPRVTYLFQNYDSGIGTDSSLRRMGIDQRRSYSHETAASALSIVISETNSEDRGAAMAVRLEYWPDQVEDVMVRRLLREIDRSIRKVVSNDE